MRALSHGLRGAIVAGPGKELFVADYTSIEAMVLLWLAGDEQALGVFRRKEDIYCYMANDIYGYPTTKATHPKERGMGKIAVLGLGFQMGAAKFVDTCADQNPPVIITPDFAQKVVDAYRKKFWRVKKLWKDMEEAACLAASDYEGEVECGDVTWTYPPDQDFLFCILPSGRRLAYPFPEVHMKVTPWGEERQQLTFMGIDKFHQWRRQSTYGGSLVENVVQAIARDIMAEAMLRCEESGLYLPVLSVHDEIMAEAEIGLGNLKEFETLLTILPPWAEGLPIAVEGWQGTRYKK